MSRLQRALLRSSEKRSTEDPDFSRCLAESGAPRRGREREAPRPRRCLKPRPGRWCAKGMTHVLNVDHPDPAAMLLSTATDQAHQGRPCGLPATDISAEIGHITPAERQDLIASSAHFPELAAFIEGCHHAADRGRRACLCASHPDLHAGRRPVCRLLCRPDRPELAAGRALRADLSVPVLNAIQPRRLRSGILSLSLKERLGGRYPPWKGSASAMHGALLFARTGKTSSSVEKLRGGHAARRAVAGIHRPSPHIKVVSSPKSLIR